MVAGGLIAGGLDGVVVDGVDIELPGVVLGVMIRGAEPVEVVLVAGAVVLVAVVESFGLRVKTNTNTSARTTAPAIEPHMAPEMALGSSTRRVRRFPSRRGSKFGSV